MRILLMLLLFFVSACGFKPMYATGGGAHFAENPINLQIDDIKTGIGQQLRIEIEDRFDKINSANGKPYRLIANVQKNLQPVLTDQDRRISRYNVIIKSNYNLIDLENGKVVAKGTLSARSAYNVVQSEYATYAADDNATKEATTQLAENYLSTLTNYFIKAK